ncbi:MAG: CBS domain-containing protein [Thermogladius sp.]|nr:CBS domain-containing protein [Thermogladius sp.]
MKHIASRVLKPRRGQDHYRWLRSDGSPNFSDKIYRVEGELEVIASKPAVRIPLTAPIMKAVEEMAKGYRGLIVSQKDKLDGILLATHVVNYLGGGPFYRIVERKHGYNIYSALGNEAVESIYEKNVVTAGAREKVYDALYKMVVHNVGFLPVIDDEGGVVGVITEHDLVKVLSGLYEFGVEASKIMSRPVITISSGSTLKEAMEKMVATGFRRLPVVEDEAVVGILTVVDVVRYYGSHEVFKKCTTGDIREANSISVRDVMRENAVTAHPDTDVSELVRLMEANNVGSVLIVDESGVLQGIVTERDILYAITMPK